MEILATETYLEPSIFGMLITIALGVIASLALVGVIIGATELELGTFLASFAVLVASAVSIYHVHVIGGTEYVRHEVIVNDYNEVFEKGYKVVDQDGKITVIQKEKESDSE